MAPNTGITTDSSRLAVDMCDLHSSRWGITEILAFMVREMHWIPFGKIYGAKPEENKIIKGPE